MTTKNDHPELLAQLAEGVARLTSSDAWREHLVFQSRFHRYSYGNVLLIAAQCHEATQVAGFHAWRTLDRFVRKGEKAIWILAPVLSPDPDDPSGEARTVRGFRSVPVFDISQTDGAPVPTVCTKLRGEDDSGYTRLLNVAASIGFGVEDHEFSGTTNGDCSPSERRIRVETRNTPAQRLKTLAHELAHALLHEDLENRALAELEAESVAYVVCREIGIDSGDYSFGYVATWAGGGDQAVAAIKSSCDRIQKTAAAILRGSDVEQQRAA